MFSNTRGRHEGAALQPYAEGWIRDGGVRYWISNLVVDADGEEDARGSCYLAIIETGDGAATPRVQLTGLYADRLTRRDGRWKFASRQIARDE